MLPIIYRDMAGHMSMMHHRKPVIDAPGRRTTDPCVPPRCLIGEQQHDHRSTGVPRIL
jgi:hypothetical protein